MIKFYKLFCITLVFALFTIVKSDSCTKKDKKLKDSCNIHVRSGVTATEQKELIDAHNIIRQEMIFIHDGVRVILKLSNFQWDEELADAAQKWANKCKNRINECRSTDNYETFEQLVYKEEDNKPINLTEIVNKWAEEGNNPVKPKKMYHAAMNRVGCGIKASKVEYTSGLFTYVLFGFKTHFVVCNYASIL